MKITGTRSYIKVEENGRTAWFDGELGFDGFYAIATTMKWLPPFESFQITEDERFALMRAVREEVRDNQYKVYFTNDKYEAIEF